MKRLKQAGGAASPELKQTGRRKPAAGSTKLKQPPSPAKRPRKKARVRSKDNLPLPRKLLVPWLVHQLLVHPAGVDEDEVLDFLTLDQRTFRGYVQLLRERFEPWIEKGVPLLTRFVDDTTRKATLKLSAPPRVEGLPKVVARLGSLGLLAQLLGVVGGPLRSAAEDARREFAGSLTRVRGDLRNVQDNLDRMFHVRLAPGRRDYTAKQAVLEQLLNALTSGRVAEVVYRQPGGGEKTHALCPLTLTLWQSSLYLLARYPTGGDPARATGNTYVYSIDRILRVRLLDRAYAYPSTREYSLEATFRGIHGMLLPRESERKPVVVDLVFEPGWEQDFVADREWGLDQRLERLPNGRLRVTFTLFSTLELAPFLKGFGSAVQVINPPELRREVMAPRPPDARKRRPDA